MGGGAVLFAVSILYVIEAQGLQHVFVQHGKDLYLDVQKPVELDKKTDLFWRFNPRNNIGKINYNREAVLFDGYEGRAELFGQNYSMLLKNVQHSDSGHYAAIIVGGQEQKVTEYKVTVQDPVSPVNLTVDSVSSSSDSCNLTVTCSTTDAHISSTFTCDTRSCSQVEQKSLKAAVNYLSITVYTEQDFIITCNHSNQVSWEQSKKEIKPYCETTSDGVSFCVVKTVVFSVGLIIMVFAVISVHVMEKIKKKEESSLLTNCT